MELENRLVWCVCVCVTGGVAGGAHTFAVQSIVSKNSSTLSEVRHYTLLMWIIYHAIQEWSKALVHLTHIKCGWERAAWSRMAYFPTWSPPCSRLSSHTNLLWLCPHHATGPLQVLSSLLECSTLITELPLSRVLCIQDCKSTPDTFISSFLTYLKLFCFI